MNQLYEGDCGNAIYAAVADYAANAGLTFIRDPAGLSDTALRRRTEAMLSSALKHGTTQHLAPHPRQISGDEALGIPPLKWAEGQHLDNIAALIEVSNASLVHHVPEIARARYDFATRTFRTGEGKPITDRLLRTWDEHPRVRAARAGRRALKRSILINTLLCAESGGRPGLLELALRQSRQLVTQGDLRGTFYQRDLSDPKSALSRSKGGVLGLLGNLDWKRTTKEAGALFSSFLTDAMGRNARFKVLSLVPGQSLFAELGKRLPTAQEYLGLKQAMDAERNKWQARSAAAVEAPPHPRG